MPAGWELLPHNLTCPLGLATSCHHHIPRSWREQKNKLGLLEVGGSGKRFVESGERWGFGGPGGQDPEDLIPPPGRPLVGQVHLLAVISSKNGPEWPFLADQEAAFGVCVEMPAFCLRLISRQRGWPTLRRSWPERFEFGPRSSSR